MDFATLYPWLLALHIIFVIYWMAGMFMLPRYFAYHAECEAGSAEDLAWQDREAKIVKIIINPAMGIVFVLGFWLAGGLQVMGEPWFWAKFALVFALGGLHGFLSKCRKQFVAGTNTRTSRQFRMINEIPTLAVIPIVLLVVFKPWAG